MRSENFMNFVIGVLLTIFLGGILLIYTAPDAFIQIVCTLNGDSSGAPACQLQSSP